MNKFFSLHFKKILIKLHAGEHYDFFQNGIIHALLTVIATLPTLSPIFGALQSVFQREDDVYKQSLAATQTGAITFLHEKRIALFNHFWSSVAMAKYYNNPALAQAAEKLQFLRNNYKHIPTANYQDASGMMTNFLEDCLKPEWKPSIEALDLLAIITMEQTTNEEFKALYVERSIEKTATAEIGKLSEIRTEVDSAFDAFIENVNVAWRTNEMVAKDATVRNGLLEVRRIITAAITQAETNLARRGHHKTKDDDKNDNTDDGTQTPITPPTPPPPGTQQPNTDRPDASQTTQNPTDEPHHLDPNEHPAMGERKADEQKKKEEEKK
jgi:hypothetical protein